MKSGEIWELMGVDCIINKSKIMTIELFFLGPQYHMDSSTYSKTIFSDNSVLLSSIFVGELDD